MSVKQQRLMLQVLVVALIVTAFLLATSQLVTPYIAHDDLNFLMPNSWTGGHATPWSATLTDGRWINYLWYQVSMHLTPRSAYVLFFLAYLVLTCTTTFNVTKSKLFGVCGLAIFFSPMFGDLSLWPSALFSGTLLCAVATYLIARADRRYVPALLFASTVILVVAYPPLSAIVLLMAGLKGSDSGFKRKIIFAVLYVVGFALGTLLIYGLNLAFHGYFGIRIASWRYPHPLRSLSDLSTNLMAYGTFWNGLLRAYWPAMICGALAGALLLFKAATRSKAITVLLAAALVCCIELGITLITGVIVPNRAAVWLWLAICLLCALAAMHPSPIYRYAGSALLLALVVLGARSWWTLYRQKQPTAQYESQLAARIHRHKTATNASEVIFMGNPRTVPELHGLFALEPIPQFRMTMLAYGIQTVQCSVEFCANARKYFESHPAHLLTELDGKLVLVFDPHGHSAPVARNYPTKAEEAELKLNYPIFLRYAQASARVTPFFPGTQKRPVSVWLAPSIAGYTLQMMDSACTFPVDYALTSSSGKQLVAGELHGVQPVKLPRWSTRDDDVSLSISMAAGAKNNYSCNVMVAQEQK